MNNIIRVGLETHLSIATKKKLFCDCDAKESSCERCRATPGWLPLRINANAVYRAALLAKYLNSEVNPKLNVYRKHYHYYDLPAGFQRTQHPLKPFFKGGSITLSKSKTTVYLKNGYLEQDPAATVKKGVSYKRCGTPLLEVVTDIIEGPIEQVKKTVREYLLTLYRLCKDLKICSKSMKSDVNVSTEGSPRYEVKNITSVNSILEVITIAARTSFEDASKVPKTFHYRNNKLEFSRLKSKYLFSRESNLPIYGLKKILELVEKNLTKNVTLYYVFKELQKISTNRLNYTYAKKIVKSISELDLTPDKVKELYNLEPQKGLKVLELAKKNSTELQTIVHNELKYKCFTTEDFRKKSRAYLEFLKCLKCKLVSMGVPFSSYTINSIVDKYFQNQLG
jgi:Glu-tRNA(Gln) amidotransferase subunit E-like FAD-binding protein